MPRVAQFFLCLVAVTSLPLSVTLSQPDTSQTVVPLNINNHLYFISNSLRAGFAGTTYNGSTYPAREFRVAYEDDLEWGGYVTSGSMRELRISGVHYTVGIQPGAILTAAPPPGYDPLRVYRMRRDYQTADLRQDAADYFSKEPADVTDNDLALLRRQYADDWQNWPTTLGAPFYDTNANGVRDPDEDPGLLDADMVCWSAVNDLDPVKTAFLYGSVPTGMEIQSTWWGYKGTTDALYNSIFVRYRLMFKGTAALSQTARIDSVFLTKFVDTDLGYTGDDLLGCDTLLQTGYTFNANPQDGWNTALVPPAVGWQLLQGPLVSDTASTGYRGFTPCVGCKNLRLQSFMPKFTGTSWGDPPFGSNGLKRMYRWMRGYLPDPDTTPLRMLEDDKDKPTFFLFAGDPVSGRGNIDGVGVSYAFTPGDRRFLLNTGPITMALGDTQDVVYAVVGAAGKDRLRNVNYMKLFAKKIQQAYPDLASLRVYETRSVEPAAELPSNVTLWSNYPNPFNPGTTIRFDLPYSTVVRLSIYDIMGREVKKLVDGIESEGIHSTVWDGRDGSGSAVASGMYMFQLQAGGMRAVKRMLLVR